MESVDIEGIKVLFPFKPYDIQLDYMKCVIKCLQKKFNGLLESPTGTGKTLCLLCSTLAWVETLERQAAVNRLANTSTNDIKIPQILYSSRTHSQLSQTVQQLKQTPYKKHKSVVIASREQLCLNSEVKSLSGSTLQSQMCRQMCKLKKCQFYENYERKVDNNIDKYNEKRDNCQVLDIEDLKDFGQKYKCCPFYGSRHLSKKSSLVLSPYNYILDPKLRKMQSLDIKDSVVIFDEGHNIERMCEESVSLEIRSDTFAICIKHIDSTLQTLDDIKANSYKGLDFKEYSELNIEDVAKVKMMACDLESALDSMVKSKSALKTLHDTRAIFEIIDRIGLEFKTSQNWIDILNNISVVLTNSTSLMASQKTMASAAISSLAEFIEKLVPIKNTTYQNYESYKSEFIKKFKIFSERAPESEDEKKNFWNKKSDPDSWVLYIWCLSPSIGAKALIDLGIHSMIITSGTLAPINSFEVEMDLIFPIRLQNNHIIEENKLSIINISNSRDGTVLTSKYDNRDNLQYYRGLGYTIIELMKVVPKGALVFFSSYTALNKCILIWKQSDQNIWLKLNAIKQIFLEPRNKTTFSDCILKYKLKVDEPNSSGALFFGVCRGKLSEGIDLPDDYCRCVIMTGLPFPSVADPRVMLKKQYLNEAKTKLSADGWYALQMKRALNQSIGRVVRHKDDFGVILLMDSRFASLSDGLSKWVEKFIYRNRSNNLDQTIDKIQTFFKTNISQRNSNNFFNTNSIAKRMTSTPNTSLNSKTSNGIIGSALKSSKNGLIDEKRIFAEYKSNDTIVSKSKSIFDSMFAAMNPNHSLKENKSKECSPKKSSINESNESPLKKPKLNDSVKPITPSVDPKQRHEFKLQSIIKTKPNSESNSAKKVIINENKNRIHEIKPIVLDFDDDEEDTESIIEEESKPIDNKPKKEDKTEQKTQTSQKSNDEMLKFWRKCGAELKVLFKDSNKFNQLCQSIKTYKRYKNLRLLSMSFVGVFEKIDEQKRNHFIRELSIIVPKCDYYSFLKLCDIKLTDEELNDNKEFKVIKRQVIDCESK